MISNSIEHAQNVNDLKELEYCIYLFDHKARNARITALALGFISLFLFAGSFVLFGMGTLSPNFLMGLGIFPYLGGALLSFIAVGILCGMLIYAAIASVRVCQKEHWHGVWMRTQSETI